MTTATITFTYGKGAPIQVDLTTTHYCDLLTDTKYEFKAGKWVKLPKFKPVYGK